MHRVYNVCECETLIRQEFLEFVSGVTVNPVTDRTAGDGLTDLGEILRLLRGFFSGLGKTGGLELANL